MTSVLMVCVVAFVAVGCKSLFSGVPVADDAMYRRGVLRGVVDAPLPEVEAATEAAMQELDFVAIEPETGGLEAAVKARMADGTRVRVRMEALDFESTAVRIKVGRFGNDSISIQLLRHIRGHL
jgi:hypothetical protein